MAEIEYIKDLYENEGLSLREIARRTKKDFRTVQKYAYQNNWNPAVEPRMKPEDYPMLGEYIPIINEWLENDEREPRKQRHTISRVYKRLQKEHGYIGSYSSVKRYVNRKKAELKKRKESFLPLAHPPGYAQADFGDFKYYDAYGREREGHALVVTFPQSNTGWMQVFPSENQECLLTGLKRIFYHIGGVPIRELIRSYAIQNEKVFLVRCQDGNQGYRAYNQFEFICNSDCHYITNSEDTAKAIIDASIVSVSALLNKLKILEKSGASYICLLWN